MVAFLISVLSLVIVVMIVRNGLPNDDPHPSPAMSDTLRPSLTPGGQSTLLTTTAAGRSQFTGTPTITATATERRTPTISATMTKTPQPTDTMTPRPSSTPSPTPNIRWSGYEENCDLMVYEGIQHCTKGPYQIVRIDPKNPYVRFETVLPLGYDRYGNYAECRDVNVPDSVIEGKSTGPGCFIDHTYPGERVGHMASRYPGAIVAFNGDFFSSTYEFGAIGLTVKNGERFDGIYNDHDGREVQRSSLSISRDGDVRIGIVPRESLPDPDQPWTWIPDADEYYNSIGGLPKLVDGGYPVDLYEQCMLEEGWCPDTDTPRARTAFGKTFDGKVFVVVVPEEWGLTIEALSHLMVELGAEEAINLDGGGSTQLWYAGSYLLYSSRPVAEGLIVFSEPITNMEALE
jgi:hypothetical protein